MGFGAGCDGGSGNSRPVPFFMVPPAVAAAGVVMQVLLLGLPVSAAAAKVQVGLLLGWPATIGYVGGSASGPCDCLLRISKL